ncbi:MAG: hypothetical protein JXQ96_14770 [Cyclobacteriaceae bacterium]
MTHEDDRRILTSIPYKDGEIKIIIAKKDCELGNHYHKIKTEEFTLISGMAILELNGDLLDMWDGSRKVNPNDRHSFEIKKDSILTCICSHPYDENDDYTD